MSLCVYSTFLLFIKKSIFGIHKYYKRRNKKTKEKDKCRSLRKDYFGIGLSNSF